MATASRKPTKKNETGSGQTSTRKSKPVRAIKVGDVIEEYLSDGDRDDQEEHDLDAYVGVDVTVDGKVYSVGCCIGIEPSEQGSARASGAMTCYGGGPDAWWSDRADFDRLPEERVDDVLEKLNQGAGRLWRQVEELREERRSARANKARADLESPEEWYDSLGNHREVRAFGAIKHPIVEYADLTDEADFAELAHAAIDEIKARAADDFDDDDLNELADAVNDLVEYARKARKDADALHAMLSCALDIYVKGDFDGVRAALDDADSIENEYGWASSVRRVEETLKLSLEPDSAEQYSE